MTKDEALRFLASASMRNHLSLPIGSTAAIEHNQKVAEAVNVLALYLGLNIEIKDPSLPPQLGGQK